MKLEGPRMKQKIMVPFLSYIHFQRFLRNEPNLLFDLNAYGADVFFNPDYNEVDRVLDVRIVPKDESIDVQLENNPDIEALLP